MTDAVIFDCDGVLVDSEPLAVEEIVTMMERLGLPIDASRIYDSFLGQSFQKILDAAFEEHGVDLTPHVARFQDDLACRFRRDLQPVPGIADAIGGLNLPIAVASSSAPDRLRLSLSVTGLKPLFGDHVYSAVQVRNGKPAPDLFLMAAQRLGVAPGDCTVLEDSPAGVRAAHAAGMRVIGFLGGSHAAPARLATRLADEKPHAMIESAAELPDTLARLG
ncbi:HAD family hydrolase [Paracoccus sp. 1_MG-2023]|uniref:HAD family hydrolase n=1 Tax=unclassified Paracoccus (in: a-proteobacteria) TaxID=2688777 RepID=UPI001C08521F|nr:HAD family hydrolase [Paracoccus sp. 1_MG-2023]MBU2958321.1 HAD family hydrolase [Paracoccus sp. C2R09]MDO6668448.1 HAD family hydrolase [Paracoccus sp. 1_MG-2023]